MASERTMWLVWVPNKMDWESLFSSHVFATEGDANAYLSGCGSNWRCSQITVKETDGE